MRNWMLIGLSCALLACQSTRQAESAKPLGHVERYDAALDALVPAEYKIEKLAEGFTWSEGPLWVEQGSYLLFTDVPQNTLYRWSQGDGLRIFMRPSGYAGPDTGVLREPGANGLGADRAGSVLLADSGNRMIARLDLASKTKTPLAKNYQGRRFNSPNDVTRRRDGTIFFTDPPYGLKELNESSVKELSFNGVYRLDVDGTVSVIDDELSFPNGVALSPDERTLYVSNSDPKRPIWMAYDLDGEGKVVSKRVFADASDLVGSRAPGLPDGLKVAPDGHLFATGPGGVLVFAPDGKRLGRIETGSAIANCAFGDDGRSLYMTSHKFLARMRLRAPAAQN